ncbi:hypothetical protein KGF56_004810 [Candida oxycetoniae]|uniref:Uncharacterized protein n=1 Tax=Candida oxycetoniae TaxID=497107 RepID=A0AAI9STH9_9ASCO|nr:uncharacterized protein KGF56_004810 [Candida oxycetoniae]KAI3402402.2 hypothetical protein KGF56_004810 [Candida oxycetoniae]
MSSIPRFPFPVAKTYWPYAVGANWSYFVGLRAHKCCKDSGLWIQDSGLRTSDSGLWTSDSGLWTQDSLPGPLSPMNPTIYLDRVTNS